MKRRSIWLGSALGVAIAAGAWTAFRALEARQVRKTLDQAKQEIAAKRYTTAWEQLLSVPSWSSGKAEADYQLGLCALYRGHRDEALQAWQRVPSGSSFAALAAVQGAMLNLDLGRFTRAEEMLRQALDHETGSGRDQLHRALELLYRIEGRTDDVRRAILASWNDADKPASVIQQLYRLETSPSPIETSREVLAKAPKEDNRVRLGLANLATRTGQFDEAARWLATCLKERPDDPILWRARLELARSSGDVEIAREALDHVSSNEYSPADRLRIRGWLAGLLGDVETEQSTLKQVVEIEPGDTAALDRLIALAASAGNLAEAAKLRDKRAEAGAAKERYRILLRGEVDESNAAELARIAEKLGRTEEAKGWALIRDSKAGDPPRASLVTSEPTGSIPNDNATLAALNADLLSKKATSRSVTTATGSVPRFVDDATSAGLSFYQENGKTPLRLLPETMSGGVGLLDFDGDGRLDGYAVQGGPFPPPAGSSPNGDRLFRNLGNGSFEDVSTKAGIDRLPGGYGHGIAVGDYDNDGDPDIFLTRWRSYLMLRNRGDGTFENVTEESGFGGNRDWPTSAAWADLDADGDLDLYVCHYLVFDLDKPRICTDKNSGKNDYCSPREFQSIPDHVFRNDGCKFVDITESAGFVDPHGRGLGVVAADLDDDNRIDLFVANDMSANYLFRNLGNGRFEETALLSGAFANSSGGYQSGMGIACGDLDGDDRTDLAVTNYYGEATTFFHNLGNGLFTDDTASIGLAAPTRQMLGFGIAFLDANNDGYLDVIQTNGHVSDLRPAFPWKMPIQLMTGGAGGRLTDVSSLAGEPLRPLLLGRGLAVGDLDNDGRVDALVMPENDPLVYLHNQSEPGNWLTLQLEGVQSNRDGVGARVRVEVNGKTKTAQRIGGGSYQSAHDARLHFGLGSAQQIDRVEVRWPSGKVDRWQGLPVNHAFRLKEGSREPTPLEGWKNDSG